MIGYAKAHTLVLGKKPFYVVPLPSNFSSLSPQVRLVLTCVLFVTRKADVWGSQVPLSPVLRSAYPNISVAQGIGRSTENETLYVVR